MRSILTGAVVVMMASAGGARGDDAFVCDGGRLVYARPETLEKLKASDPCVGAHFKGQSQASSSVPPLPASAAPAPSERTPGSSPAPLKKPNPFKAADGRTAPSVPAFSPEPEKSAAPRPLSSADFRNVRVINGAPGAPVYRHTR